MSTETSKPKLEPGKRACLSHIGFEISPKSIVSIEIAKKKEHASLSRTHEHYIRTG